MDTRAIASEYRLTHWSGVMRERQDSGMSIRAYCESVGIHENVYYYWQRKLREAACHELNSTNQINTGNEIVPRGWSICDVSEAKVQQKSNPERKENELIVEIGKCLIKVTPSVDINILSKVCETLVSLC